MAVRNPFPPSPKLPPDTDSDERNAPTGDPNVDPSSPDAEPSTPRPEPSKTANETADEDAVTPPTRNPRKRR